jgi:hypothetical protein
MPALVKSSPGESGSNEADGTIVWPCWAKKSRKDWRIWALVIFGRRLTANDANRRESLKVFGRMIRAYSRNSQAMD